MQIKKEFYLKCRIYNCFDIIPNEVLHMPPKYKRLADVLRDNIKKKLAPGDRLPTRRELMERHAVSLSTVEGALRILSDEQLISCHVGRGTFVNDSSAQKEKPATSGIICMFSEFQGQGVISNLHQGPICEGIRNVLDGTGLHLTMSDYGSIDDINSYNGFSGLIFMAPTERQKNLIKKFQNSNVPSVIISASWEDVNTPSVDCDNEYGIRCALRYLTDRGHTRIGYVDQNYCSFDALARRSAFKNMAGEFEIECRNEWFIAAKYENLDDETLFNLRNMFTLESRPTALIFSSFFPVTMKIIAELKNMNLYIPRDVSLIGFDDSSWARCMKPALTVIEQPLNNMGRHAAERLLEQLNGKAYVKHEILPIELIERRSVAVANI